MTDLRKVDPVAFRLQAEAAERWFQEELKRLREAGHAVVGDSVIIEVKK